MGKTNLLLVVEETVSATFQQMNQIISDDWTEN